MTLCVCVIIFVVNGEYLVPQIRSMNIWFHSEAKLPWSYDYHLANHIATYKSSANRVVPLFSHLHFSFGYVRKIFPSRGLKYSVLHLIIKAWSSLLNITRFYQMLCLCQWISNYCQSYLYIIFHWLCGILSLLRAQYFMKHLLQNKFHVVTTSDYKLHAYISRILTESSKLIKRLEDCKY